MRELRLAIDCSAAELAGAVQALRYQGKLNGAGQPGAFAASDAGRGSRGQPEGRKRASG
jgi:hypothetical protein